MFGEAVVWSKVNLFVSKICYEQKQNVSAVNIRSPLTPSDSEMYEPSKVPPHVYCFANNLTEFENYCMRVEVYSRQNLDIQVRYLQLIRCPFIYCTSLEIKYLLAIMQCLSHWYCLVSFLAVIGL